MDSTYIRENGLLELYLFGEVNEEERLAIEQALSSDNSLKEELISMEQDLESIAMENAIEPPSEIKSNLTSAISSQLSSSNQDQKIFQIPEKKSLRFPFYAAAAVAAILLINSVWLYNEWRSSEERFQTLESKSIELQLQLAGIESELDETSEWFAMVNDPEMEKLILRGNDRSPESVAVAYVNDSEKTVVLKTDGLKELPSDKTYQMWADVEGEMIDMGVIPRNQDMVRLTYIDNAESFNITIEPEGGNDHPTVEELITNVIL